MYLSHLPSLPRRRLVIVQIEFEHPSASIALFGCSMLLETLHLRLSVIPIESGLQGVQAEEAPFERGVSWMWVRHREHFRGRLVKLGRAVSHSRRFLQEVKGVELVMCYALALFLMKEVVCDELPLSWKLGLEGRLGEVRLWLEALVFRREWLNWLHLFARVNLFKLGLKRTSWFGGIVTTICWPQV